jgi:hypothetical protein
MPQLQIHLLFRSILSKIYDLLRQIKNIPVLTAVASAKAGFAQLSAAKVGVRVQV